MVRETGLHLLGTLIDCNPEIMDNKCKLFDFMKDFPIKLGMTVPDISGNPMIYREKKEYGYMCVVLLYESHFSLHCWPECNNSVDFDMFSCKKFDNNYAMKLLIDFFRGTPVGCVLLERGHFGVGL
jgi:S-adenosylmethionine/arginine decarboxylase-like enzyme